jgi:hypothetical protein
VIKLGNKVGIFLSFAFCEEQCMYHWGFQFYTFLEFQWDLNEEYMHSKFSKSAYMTQRVFHKIDLGYQNAEFYADSKLLVAQKRNIFKNLA